MVGEWAGQLHIHGYIIQRRNNRRGRVEETSSIEVKGRVRQYLE